MAVDSQGRNVVELLDLPNEVLELIFHHLPIEDVQLRLALICKRLLKISRTCGMVKKYSYEISLWCLRVKDVEVEKECLRYLAMIESLLNYHPACLLDLTIIYNTERYFSFAWEKLKQYRSSINKLTLRFGGGSFDSSLQIIAEDQITFDALKKLEIDTGNFPTETSRNMMQERKPQFYFNFSNLTHLNVSSNHRNQFDIVSFINDICIKSPKLQNLSCHSYVISYYSFDMIGTILKLDSEPIWSQQQFEKLNELEILIDCEVDIDLIEAKKKENRVLENLHHYFMKKCPKIGSKIDYEVTETDEVGDLGISRVSFTFCNKNNTFQQIRSRSTCPDNGCPKCIYGKIRHNF